MVCLMDIIDENILQSNGYCVAAMMNAIDLFNEEKKKK